MRLPTFFLGCIFSITTYAQTHMKPKDEVCVQSARAYSMLIEKKAAKSSEAELLETVSRTTLPPVQKSRLSGLVKLFDGSEIKDKTRLVQEFYLKCSLN